MYIQFLQYLTQYLINIFHENEGVCSSKDYYIRHILIFNLSVIFVDAFINIITSPDLSQPF